MLLSFFFCLTAVQLQGQYIAFTYDKAGNRIERKTFLLKSSSASENEPEQLFEDSLADQEIRIYPNPTEGHLMVSISPLVLVPWETILKEKLLFRTLMEGFL